MGLRRNRSRWWAVLSWRVWPWMTTSITGIRSWGWGEARSRRVVFNWPGCRWRRRRVGHVIVLVIIRIMALVGIIMDLVLKPYWNLSVYNETICLITL